MNDLDRVFVAASAACEEATRRWFGDAPDARFDVPIAMLLDLDETLSGPLAAPDGVATGMSRNGDVAVSGAQDAPQAAA